MNIKSKITDELKKEVALLLKQERNLVVKERLTYISMYVNGITKRDIANMVGRTKETVGTWINKYFKDGIEAIQDNRGGDHKGYLTTENKKELKNIILNTYPIVYKGWDGWIIVDLIKTKYDVTYTRGGVYALLKSLGITHKIATKIDPKKSEEKIAIWKEDIKKNFLTCP
jgi:transposase